MLVVQGFLENLKLLLVRVGGLLDGLVLDLGEYQGARVVFEPGVEVI